MVCKREEGRNAIPIQKKPPEQPEIHGAQKGNRPFEDSGAAVRVDLLRGCDRDECDAEEDFD